LITGVARGIGRELLSLLQEGGHEVYAVLRPGTNLDQLGLAGHAEVDLARPDRVADAVAELAAGLGSLDGFVHCAGITRGGRLPEATLTARRSSRHSCLRCGPRRAPLCW
jgi:NAD(P)-dependent dehydrogenase (short-subunit alcohol dehydrogenase family)